jgi:hypothetical protein
VIRAATVGGWDAARVRLSISKIGQTRYNLRLAFSRFGTARANEGYQGQVVVCSAKFLPVAGYDPKHFLVTYLAAQHETEIWLAPLTGTRLLVPTGRPYRPQWVSAFWKQQDSSFLFPTKVRAKTIATDTRVVMVILSGDRNSRECRALISRQPVCSIEPNESSQQAHHRASRMAKAAAGPQ